MKTQEAPFNRLALCCVMLLDLPSAVLCSRLLCCALGAHKSSKKKMIISLLEHHHWWVIALGGVERLACEEGCIIRGLKLSLAAISKDPVGEH